MNIHSEIVFSHKPKPVFNQNNNYLGVSDDPDDLAVLFDSLELGVDLLWGLRELLRVPGEGLLL